MGFNIGCNMKEEVKEELFLIFCFMKCMCFLVEIFFLLKGFNGSIEMLVFIVKCFN